MTSTEIQTETKKKMEKTLEILKEEFKSIRSGRLRRALLKILKSTVMVL